MKRNKLTSTFRTMPKNPKAGETYWSQRWAGEMVLVTHPLRWMVYDWTINPHGLVSDLTEADAIKIFKTEKTAQKFAATSDNYSVWGLHN